MSTTIDYSSNAPRIIAISVSTVSIAMICVCIRLYTRIVIIKYAGLDDWIIFAAGILSVGTSICTVLRTKYGLGRHVWTVPESETEPGLQVFYVAIILYNLAQVFVKISIIFLYIRIFDKGVKRSCYIALFIVALYGIGAVGTSIVACVPIEAFWDKNVSGTCLGAKKFWYTQSSFNIVTDFGILLLPLPVLTKLKLAKKQKTGLIAIFTVGFFACVVSIVRLRTLGLATDSTDPTWDDEAAATWSLIELNAGIVCACLQTLKPFVRKFSKSLDTIKSSEAARSGGTGARPGLEANTISKSISRRASSDHDPLPLWDKDSVRHHETSTDRIYESDAVVLEAMETAGKVVSDSE